MHWLLGLPCLEAPLAGFGGAWITECWGAGVGECEGEGGGGCEGEEEDEGLREVREVHG